MVDAYLAINAGDLHRVCEVQAHQAHHGVPIKVGLQRERRSGDLHGDLLQRPPAAGKCGGRTSCSGCPPRPTHRFVALYIERVGL